MGEGWGEGEIRHPRHCEDLPLILSLSKDHPELVEGRANPVPASQSASDVESRSKSRPSCPSMLYSAPLSRRERGVPSH